MRRIVLCFGLAAVVAACGHKATEETQTTVTKNGVTTTTIVKRAVAGDDHSDATISGLKIDSDKFKADLEIPGISFGGDHMDMDGMKLYPGSTVKGVRVHAVDRPGTKKGEVTMDFTSPAAPLKVAEHMAEQARKAGFTLTSNTAARVSGTKTDDGDVNTFDITLNSNGASTAGVMTMSGMKE